jgi:uncharacterized protein
MLVREMTRNECADLLSDCHLARLACAKDGQPYMVPFYFAFAGDHLYSFSTPGQEIDWMRSNPRVCVEVDRYEDHRGWRSVIVSGAYEELSDVPKCAKERERAWALLSRRANCGSRARSSLSLCRRRVAQTICSIGSASTR